MPPVVLTVTVSLMPSVSVITLPALKSPLAGESVIELIAGAVVLICGPLWVRPESDRLAALPAPSVMLAALRLTAVAVSAAVFWPAPTV